MFWAVHAQGAPKRKVASVVGEARDEGGRLFYRVRWADEQGAGGGGEGWLPEEACKEEDCKEALREYLAL